MSRSWASVARGSALRAEAPEYTPDATAASLELHKMQLQPLCHDCQAAAEVCANGCRRPPVDTWGKKAICGRCYYNAMDRLGSDMMSCGVLRGYDAKNDPPFLCCACSDRRYEAKWRAAEAADAASKKLWEAEQPAREAAEAASEAVWAAFTAAVDTELAHAATLGGKARYRVLDRAHDRGRRNKIHDEAKAAYEKTFKEEKARLGL
jgi:hypothetical protein